ncbi:hypothetical protein Scep_010339 [Stephania cephalantha]|uniref:RNase H type-1 domain-containing protein n=1 Tax=Stephania cephalantha TaxID=152367 RepID=A0AAP0JW55_9MAGN
MKAIPAPSAHKGEDTVSWQFNKAGRFIVKEAYRFITASDSSPNPNNWRNIWEWEGPNVFAPFSSYFDTANCLMEMNALKEGLVRMICVEGCVQKRLSERLRGLLALVTEFWSIKTGLETAKREGFLRLIVESDSLEAIDLSRGPSSPNLDPLV